MIRYSFVKEYLGSTTQTTRLVHSVGPTVNERKVYNIGPEDLERPYPPFRTKRSFPYDRSGFPVKLTPEDTEVPVTQG